MYDGDLEHRLTYHAPTEETRQVHEDLRTLTRDYAKNLAYLLEQDPDVVKPSSREISLALTALEESSFWAHAHIARNRQ